MLPHGGWQTIAAAETKKEAEETAAFHAKGCKTNEYFVSPDLTKVQRHVLNALFASIAERAGVDKFTLAQMAALLNLAHVARISEKLRGKYITEKDLSSLGLLLQLPAQASKKELTRRLKSAGRISQSASENTKRWRKGKERKNE